MSSSDDSIFFSILGKILRNITVVYGVKAKKCKIINFNVLFDYTLSDILDLMQNSKIIYDMHTL